MSDDLRRYLPEEIPDHLYTQNKLNMMGLAATAVLYPEQKREFRLFDINATRRRKQQKGFSLVYKDMTVEEVLEEQKLELEVRKSQLGEKYGKSK